MNDFHCQKGEIIATLKAKVDNLTKESDEVDQKINGVREEFKEEVDTRVVGVWRFITILVAIIGVAGQILVYFARHSACSFP